MRLDQFKFKNSLQFGIKEEAHVKTDANTVVTLLKNDLTIAVIKKVGNVVKYNVAFKNNGNGLEKLNKALKNIGKR